MILQEFINKYLGKKIDFDGFYGGQCVDLYRQYVKEVLGYPQSPGVGGAAEIWDSASPEYYDFIGNTPTGVPLKGDIVVWNRRAGGGFGHVAVFIEGDVNGFTSFDQNWPTLDVCTITDHVYTNVIGWLHPKGKVMANELEACMADRQMFWNERDTMLRELGAESVEGGINAIRGFKARITDLGNQLGTAQAEVTNREQQVSRLKEDVLRLQNDANELIDRIEVAAKKYEELAKEKGALAIELAQLQVQYDSLKAGAGQGLTKDSTLSQLVAWIKELFSWRN